MNAGLFDPHKANLCPEVESISHMGEEEFRLAGGAESRLRLVWDPDVLDVFGFNSTSGQQNSKSQSMIGWLIKNA